MPKINEIKQLVDARQQDQYQIEVFKKMRLNKYLSKSGVASRRKSDELIRMATTEVNGNYA